MSKIARFMCLPRQFNRKIKSRAAAIARTAREL